MKHHRLAQASGILDAIDAPTSNRGSNLKTYMLMRTLEHSSSDLHKWLFISGDRLGILLICEEESFLPRRIQQVY